MGQIGLPMGYTHYWRYTRDITPIEWESICADFRVLLANLPPHTATAGGYHSKNPLKVAYEADKPDTPVQCDAENIRFNGIGTDVGGNYKLSHGTFSFDRQASSDSTYCKTARKPYDLLVCATLTVVCKHAPFFGVIASDGGLDDWLPALEFVSAILGEGYVAPKTIRSAR